MYFKNINKLIKVLQKNLSKDGKIFIETPNIENSPFICLWVINIIFYDILVTKNIF